MTEQTMVLGASVIAILISAGTLFMDVKRRKTVLGFGLAKMAKEDRDENLKKLQMYMYILIGGIVINLVNLVLPEGMYRFIFPVVSIVLASNILINIFEDAAETEEEKQDDASAWMDYKSRRDKDIQEKSKIREEQNKNK